MVESSKPKKSVVTIAVSAPDQNFGSARPPLTRSALTRVSAGVIAARTPAGSGEVLYAVLANGAFLNCVVQSNLVCAAMMTSPDSAAGACGDEQPGLDLSRDLAHELAHGRGRTIVIEVQARLEQKDARLSDLAREVQAEAVIVAGHVGLFVVERGPAAGHQRHVTRDVMPVFVPGRREVTGREQGGECRRFRRRPGDHDRVDLALEPREVVALGRRLGERCCDRCCVCGPGRHGWQSLARGAQRCRHAGRSEPLLRVLRVVVEPQILDVDVVRPGSRAYGVQHHGQLHLAKRLRLRRQCAGLFDSPRAGSVCGI